MNIFKVITFITVLALCKNVSAQSESFLDLISNSKNIDSVAFEMTSRFVGDAQSPLRIMAPDTDFKYRLKTGYSLVDMTGLKPLPVKLIIIERPDVSYMLHPETKTYSKSNHKPIALLENFYPPELLKGSPVKFLGEEKIDDKPTTIIEAERLWGEGDKNETIKIWVWQEKGLPLKKEITTQFPEMGSATCVFSYKYINFNNVSESAFDVSSLLADYKEETSQENGTVSSDKMDVIKIDSDGSSTIIKDVDKPKDE